jgi:hypothetical protein
MSTSYLQPVGSDGSSLPVAPTVIRWRKQELMWHYGDEIRLVVALTLANYGFMLTAHETDEHAKNVVVRMIHEIEVNRWPPDEVTDNEVDRLIDAYLDQQVLIYSSPQALRLWS